MQTNFRNSLGQHHSRALFECIYPFQIRMSTWKLQDRFVSNVPFSLHKNLQWLPMTLWQKSNPLAWSLEYCTTHRQRQTAWSGEESLASHQLCTLFIL